MRVVGGSCVYFFRSNSFFILFFFAGDGTKHGLGISLIIVLFLTCVLSFVLWLLLCYLAK